MHSPGLVMARSLPVSFPSPLRWPLALLLALGAGALLTEGAGPSQEKIAFFEKKIRPVLVEHCYQCHSTQAKKIRGGLLLDSKEALRKGGDTGPALVPGQPKKSLLIQALHYDDPFLQMPPKGKLPGQVIKDFETWIQQGAIDPRGTRVVRASPTGIDFDKAKQFRAFQPPREQPLPSLNNPSWPRTRIDWFVAQRLDKEGYRPAPPADRRTWIRRVSFDLVGLPPSPEEVEAFVADPSPDAHAKLVDRLLASEHYGERWARPWLDLARYAEDQAHIVGNDRSLCYPNAYLYRDWVIQALNDDIPFDRFVQLQLAADLLEPDSTKNLPALGFIGLGPKYYQRGSLAVMADEWEDRVDVVSRGLLGLTVACARCHDHKYDPIPTEDYYSLAGVFASTRMYNRPLNASGNKETKETKKPEQAMHIIREGKVTDLPIFVRGNVQNKGPIAKRHFLHILSAKEPEPFTQGSGRLELARAITSPNNPLTARVLVNRVWGELVGRPLVGTPSNFGSLGDRPTHPELLDDLAFQFMKNGWSVKWLVREIVLSAMYRQSSQANAELLRADPDNRLLGRMNRRRLSVEAWRDSLLAVSGKLDHSIGGKSIDPRDSKERRRTLYSAISRLDLNPMLALFDFPDPNSHAARRVQTTTPLQKMFVLNSPFMIAQAKALSERLEREIPGDSEPDRARRIQRAYHLLYGRSPSEAEERLGLLSLQDEAIGWEEYAHVLLASNEMLFID
jgi:hypothetical protein